VGSGGTAVVDVADAVDEEAEGAGGGDPLVELAERAGGGVARVHEGLAILGAEALVEAGEVGLPQVDLAPDLDGAGDLTVLRLVEAERQAADGAEVGADVLADGAVAAGGAVVEAAIAVGDGDGEAVDFRLGHVRDPCAFRPSADAFGPGRELGLGVDVAEGVHGAGVGDLGEAGGWGGADALGGGLGGDELGVGRFEFAQLAHQRVPLRVGGGGLVEHEVVVIEAVDRVPELVDPALHGERVVAHRAGATSRAGVRLCYKLRTTE
jgi:hypothetical protein